jgi:hypothetical protein
MRVHLHRLLKMAGFVALAICGTASRPPVAFAQQQGHGPGPNGGTVFDLGSNHAELTVDHDKKEITILFLAADEKTPGPVESTELIVNINETRTAGGKTIATMTVVATPVDAANGKAAKFVGTDPSLGNVAEFAGIVTGEVSGKPVYGEFDEVNGGGHVHTPHDGVVAPLKDAVGKDVGFVELKLHDDKGDLELWLAKDREMKEAIDLPANSIILASFPELPKKSAKLSVRDKQKNEDEDGTPNLRNGLTNYFIFPGDTKQDAAWLVGSDFKSAVVITFEVEGKKFSTEEFTLVPHTHTEGAGHAH